MFGRNCVVLKWKLPSPTWRFEIKVKILFFFAIACPKIDIWITWPKDSIYCIEVVSNLVFTFLQWKEMFRGEGDRFSHCSDPSACLALAEKARDNDKMLKLYATRLKGMILSWLMEKLNIKRVISMQKTKKTLHLGSNKDFFFVKKITLPYT